MKGFTLVEIMATLVILTAGLVTVHQAFVRCVEGVRRSETRLYASSLAEERAVKLILDSRQIPSPPLPDAEDVDGYHIEYAQKTIANSKKFFVLSEVNVTGPAHAAASLDILTPAPEKK